MTNTASDCDNFIMRGKGSPESFNSCSHGAGRTMSRTKAKKMFTVDNQIRATESVECRKDADVIDEIPVAYKDIDAVMWAQSDLVEVVHVLKQVVCVKDQEPWIDLKMPTAQVSRQEFPTQRRKSVKNAKAKL